MAILFVLVVKDSLLKELRESMVVFDYHFGFLFAYGNYIIILVSQNTLLKQTRPSSKFIFYVWKYLKCIDRSN